MTLRPAYARPHPRAIAPPPPTAGLSPPLPPPPARPGSAVRVSWARARSCSSNPSQLQASCVHWRAQAQNPCAARACHRLDARGMAPQIGPLPPFPAARAAAGTCRSSRHRPPPPLDPYLAGCCRR